MKNPHAKAKCQYHIIWCPKFRHNVLGNDEQAELKKIISDIAHDHRYEIKALETMRDHIHVFLEADQSVAPIDIVRTLKSISAIRLFKSFPWLKKHYSKCGSLWSRGHYIATVGHVSEKTVKRYIEEQKNK